jgi:hypothetical protein
MSVSKGWHGSLSLMSVCFVVAQVFVEYAKLDAFNALRLKLRSVIIIHHSYMRHRAF